MYLTRMQLDVKKRQTMKALASPGMFHGAVENSFPGPKKRRLWRIDCLNGTWFLMIVSEDQPELGKAVEQFGITDVQWETKNYDPLLDRIQPDEYWHFRLIANPTVSRKQQLDQEKEQSEREKSRGKIYAHQTAEQQEQWLTERAPAHGFSLDRDEFRAVHQEWYNFKKKSRNSEQISISAVTYEGILMVSDSELFRRTLCEGIGRGKAYGMGMLTVADSFRRKK